VRALLLPPHFDPNRVGEVWPVAYEDRAREARSGGFGITYEIS